MGEGGRGRRVGKTTRPTIPLPWDVPLILHFGSRGRGKVLPRGSRTRRGSRRPGLRPTGRTRKRPVTVENTQSHRETFPVSTTTCPAPSSTKMPFPSPTPRCLPQNTPYPHPLRLRGSTRSDFSRKVQWVLCKSRTQWSQVRGISGPTPVELSPTSDVSGSFVPVRTTPVNSRPPGNQEDTELETGTESL